jgi:hypothetical protein
MVCRLTASRAPSRSDRAAHDIDRRDPLADALGLHIALHHDASGESCRVALLAQRYCISDV